MKWLSIIFFLTFTSCSPNKLEACHKDIPIPNLPTWYVQAINCDDIKNEIDKGMFVWNEYSKQTLFSFSQNESDFIVTILCTVNCTISYQNSRKFGEATHPTDYVGDSLIVLCLDNMCLRGVNPAQIVSHELGHVIGLSHYQKGLMIPHPLDKEADPVIDCKTARRLNRLKGLHKWKINSSL